MDNPSQKLTRQHSKGRTVASEAQETTEKDEKIRVPIEERKTTAKHEEERIREISKEIKKYTGKLKDEKTREN